MFADPIAVANVAATIPVPGFASSWSMIKNDGYGSERIDTLHPGLFSMVINHSAGKTGDRHYVKLSRNNSTAVNPVTGLIQPQIATVSLAISKPAFGVTEAELLGLIDLLVSTLYDGDLTPTRLVRFES